MKSKSLISLFCLVIPFNVIGQHQRQYFDGNDTNPSYSLIIHIDTSAGNIWQVGQPQKTVFTSAFTQPNVIVTDTINYYPTVNTSSFTFSIIQDPASYGIYAIQWMQKLNMDSTGDGGIVEFSSDTGNTWQNAFNNPNVYSLYGFDIANKDTLPSGEFAFGGGDSTWRNVWLCFDYSWLSNVDTLMFRFTFKSDEQNNDNEGWMIDNIMSHPTQIHTINEVKQDEYMKVFPNPANSRINIQTKKIDSFHIIEKMELIDINGKSVGQYQNVPTKFFIDVSDEPSGIYFLKVRTNVQSETFRVVIQHDLK